MTNEIRFHDRVALTENIASADCSLFGCDYRPPLNKYRLLQLWRGQVGTVVKTLDEDHFQVEFEDRRDVYARVSLSRSQLRILREQPQALPLYYVAAKQANPEAQTALGDCWAKGSEYWLRTYGMQLGKYRAEPQEKRVIERDTDEEEQPPRRHEHEFINGFCVSCARTPWGYCKWVHTTAVEKDYDGRLIAEEDKAEAVKWYRKAAEQDYAEAQIKLGDCYAEGWVVSNNYRENAQGHRYKQAVKWYRRAAEQGDVEAQRRLGLCYAEGIGIAQSEVQAVKWLRTAAGQGDFDAAYELGDLYARIGNKRAAAKWYRKAGLHWSSYEIRDLGPKKTW